MKAPAFWDNQNIWSRLLGPLAVLYAKAGRIHQQLQKPESAGIPVICIGNVTAGGAGKTPVALAIGQMLKAKGINAFFLSRGYGGQRTEPLLVNPLQHDALEVGDEPLLLAKCLPTIVARQRVDGAKLAKRRGAKAIIMDDGFQNPSLHKDISLLVIDGNYGLGNGCVMPAGPLREPVQDAYSRASAIILINASETLNFTLPEGVPVFKATTKAASDLSALKGKKVLAFCGIARPGKFFTLLALLGVIIEEKRSFADHHRFTAQEIEALQNSPLPLVTTAKDAVRLPAALKAKLHILDISLEFEDKASLDTLISSLF